MNRRETAEKKILRKYEEASEREKESERVIIDVTLFYLANC